MRNSTTLERDAIIAMWNSRLAAMPYAPAAGKKPGAKAMTARAEFFAGAMSAMYTLGIEMPPYWVIAIQTGREIELTNPNHGA